MSPNTDDHGDPQQPYWPDPQMSCWIFLTDFSDFEQSSAAQINSSAQRGEASFQESPSSWVRSTSTSSKASQNPHKKSRFEKSLNSASLIEDLESDEHLKGQTLLFLLEAGASRSIREVAKAKSFPITSLSFPKPASLCWDLTATSFANAACF